MSGRCSNLCSKLPKQVRMFLDANGKPTYLCARCARELGYTTPTNGGN